ncbi:DEAD/DEAH box helicase [Staphylococcus chromogenes]|uniref:DEAD/DEAH box helicase n=1 Tax=Staphylococcus chromogenes TaxID=46126 RepID=UPI0028865A93|nr:DEAD/DEAH box helicase [Staphylococcus chromogenes]MDT0672642.1 DEAD/DEAH box helicase [Staphylococcus chromogenes]MDT0674877.1 DEAD/DEAH box helicase [Staphylococcus chromogenes]
MILIKMSRNNQLVFESDLETIAKIKKKVQYKLHIKGYISKEQSGEILFKENIHFETMKKLLDKIIEVATSLKEEYEIDKNVFEYIEKVDSYISYKYTIGNDIKNNDVRFEEKFMEFSDIVSNALTRHLRFKQMKDAFYMSMMQKSGNFSVPGSGKTTSVYGMYAYLKTKRKVKRILMIGPLNSFNSWINEYYECFGYDAKLNYLNIKSLTTSNEKKIVLKYESSKKELILINYEVLQILEEELREVVDEETLVIFDEVHRIKNPKGIQANAALRITNKSKYMVTLTGTPIPNGYKDIYNLLNLLYPNDYTHFFNFDISLLDKPNNEEIKMINDKIQPFFTRTSKSELGVPLANSDKIIKVKANKDEQELLKILLSKYKSNQLALLIKILQLESSPSLLTEKLDVKEFEELLDLNTNHEDFVEFKDFSQDILDLTNKIIRTSKMEALLNLVKTIISENKTVIIWCIFVRTMTTLRSDLVKMGIKAEIISGAVTQEERNLIIKKFKNKQIDILITNPHTLAESVSLHKSCHDAIYFEYSYNLVHLLQSKDRIHRLGLDESDYTQYYFFEQYYPLERGSYSLGERIYQRLTEKEKLMLEAIDNHQLELLPTEDEDLKFFFENVIGD